MQVNYKTAEKYVGDDALDLLILFPAAFAWNHVRDTTFHEYTGS
jgi:hypothetical protein